MNIELANGYTLHCDSLNWELRKNDKPIAFNRTLNGIIERYLEFSRREQLRDLKGELTGFYEAIIKSNADTIDLIEKIITKGGTKANGERS